MSKPSASIVIPCFNDDPQHLEQSVASALGQTYPNVEVLVVDDGSTASDTVAAIDGLQGVKVLRQENRGPGSALNAGIRASKGSHILPLDADDKISPDCVSLLLATFLEADPDVVCVYPEVEYFGERRGVAVSPPEVRLTDIAVRNQVGSSGLFLRSDFDRVGGYGEFDDCSQDWFYWAVLLGRTGGRMIKEPRARRYYRIRPHSRNTVNAGRDRKQNARRHIAEALPGELSHMYLAAATLADDNISAIQRYEAFVHTWRRRLRPIMPLYRLGQRLRRRSMRDSEFLPSVGPDPAKT